MALRISKVVENDESPFYRFILKDVKFSQLSFFRSTQGSQKMRKLLWPFVPKYSIPVQKKSDGKFRGLSLPLKVLRYRRLASDNFRAPPLWILGYHDIARVRAFVLFPSSQVRYRERDLNEQNLVSYKDFAEYVKPGSEKFPHSLRISNLYIWPTLIPADRPDASAQKYYLRIPEILLFLTLSDFYSVNSDLENSIKVDQEEFIKNAKPFFHLYYDSTPCIIYLKYIFGPMIDPLSPPYIVSSRGIQWSRMSQYEELRSDLLTWDDKQHEPEWWLEDQ